MIICKSLERIADHATNVAEEVVYLYEGHDIRHLDPEQTPGTGALEPAPAGPLGSTSLRVIQAPFVLTAPPQRR